MEQWHHSDCDEDNCTCPDPQGYCREHGVTVMPERTGPLFPNTIRILKSFEESLKRGGANFETNHAKNN